VSEPPQPVHRPGDVVNGHILGVDNRWHPVQSPTEPYQGPMSLGTARPSGVKATYGEKFKRRWRVCWLVMLAVTGAATFANLVQTHSFGGPAVAWVIDLVSGTAIGGTINALILCLIVSVFPGEKRFTLTPPS
jgi:hypothetical protein